MRGVLCRNYGKTQWKQKMKNKKDTGLDKINNKLLKQVGGHLAELRKLLKEDSRAKYKMLWLKWDATLLRCLKITDLYCMQVADNKIERRENEYLKKELRNYVPEHPMFREDDTTTNSEVNTDDERQLKFDFDKDISFDDTKH